MSRGEKPVPLDTCTDFCRSRARFSPFEYFHLKFYGQFSNAIFTCGWIRPFMLPVLDDGGNYIFEVFAFYSGKLELVYLHRCFACSLICDLKADEELEARVLGDKNLQIKNFDPFDW